jgi:hypothetical protein
MGSEEVMDVYMPMSTTKRHNRLVSTLMNRIFTYVENGEYNALQEECALVYWGTKSVPNGFKLINASEIDDVGTFTETTINELDYVRPDFVLFKDNKYLENKRQTRTAGWPDLIVEVWSDGNTRNDRAFLQNLYATSDATEHWYIEQDSNEVSCYYGKIKLENQSLSDILVTRNGLKFDLRYLAV